MLSRIDSLRDRRIKRLYNAIFAMVAAFLAIFAGYTTILTSGIYSPSFDTCTSDFKYITDDPLTGTVELSAHSEMLEFEPTNVIYNITLNITGSLGMDLHIEQLEVYLTPADYLDRTEPVLPKQIGSASLIDIWVQNATRLSLQGRIEITPVFMEGDLFLGAGIEYNLRNHSESESIGWSGSDGNLLMIPVTVYPQYLRSEYWRLGFGLFAVFWIIVLGLERKR